MLLRAVLHVALQTHSILHTIGHFTEFVDGLIWVFGALRRRVILLNMVVGYHRHEKCSGKIREMKKRLGREVRNETNFCPF